MRVRTFLAVLVASTAVYSGFAANIAEAQVETRLRAPVPVDFMILSKGGVSAMPNFRAAFQVEGLNAWFQGSLRFDLGRVRVLTKADTKNCGRYGSVNPEDHYNTTNPYRTRDIFAQCYATPGAINVLITRTLGQGSSALNGVATVFAPLDSEIPPTTAVAANIFLTGAVTLTHEVGHLVGFEHTATYGQIGESEYWWYTNYYCGKNFQYPHFAIYDQWSLEVDPLHELWPGRSNPMGYLNAYTFINPSFFRGGYDRVFHGIIDCWYTQSFSSGGPETPVSSQRLAID